MKTTVDPKLSREVAAILMAVYEQSGKGGVLVGDIIPSAWYTTLLPKQGKRRTWQHCLNLTVLAHVLSWFRPKVEIVTQKDGSKVSVLTKKFGESRYKINREYLAKKFKCAPKDISEALTWAVNLGLIDRDIKPKMDYETGECIGKRAYVIPIMDRIIEVSKLPNGSLDEQADNSDNPSENQASPSQGPLQTQIRGRAKPLKGSCKRK